MDLYLQREITNLAASLKEKCSLLEKQNQALQNEVTLLRQKLADYKQRIRETKPQTEADLNRAQYAHLIQ